MLSSTSKDIKSVKLLRGPRVVLAGLQSFVQLGHWLEVLVLHRFLWRYSLGLWRDYVVVYETLVQEVENFFGD